MNQTLMLEIRNRYERKHFYIGKSFKYMRLLPCQVFLSGWHERLCGIVMLNKGTERASRYPAAPLFSKC